MRAGNEGSQAAATARATSRAAAPSSLGSVELVGVGPDAAECELLREIDGLFYSFPVSFVADSDGRWRLWQF